MNWRLWQAFMLPIINSLQRSFIAALLGKHYSDVDCSKSYQPIQALGWERVTRMPILYRTENHLF